MISSAKQKPLSEMTSNEIKAAVREKYSLVATTPDAEFNFPVGRTFAESVGYPKLLLDQLPASIWESFTGAGNPQPFVDAKPGETLLDLGCGAGLDLYLYARAVGPTGRCYGVDIAEAMAAKARENLRTLGVANVEILVGHSDNIPLPDASVEIVASNGIYNLSPLKEPVMREVFRVLKPGGRTVFAEIVLKRALPEEVRKSVKDWFRCIGGALPESDFVAAMKKIGFERIEVLAKGRNARTGHELALCATMRAFKQHT
ncbi:MAG: methyltransferase domain-containing protein [Verrucomicrobia bacterium]|nr:methyltransferase domain-containing protein [Verrucomicrobiota bacterium]